MAAQLDGAICGTGLFGDHFARWRIVIDSDRVNTLSGLQFIRFRVNTFRLVIIRVPCEYVEPDEFEYDPGFIQPSVNADYGKAKRCRGHRYTHKYIKL
jgi:hypothetical protein